MAVIARIVLGLIVGLVADKVMGSPHGITVATGVGIVGALLGGWLAEKLFHIDSVKGFFNASTWITAIIGAVALPGVVELVTDRRGVSPRRRRGVRR
jgi:uncharacterized membrane protein YeaQ/YmgE (transglycosylase-associated protein family)